MFDNDKALDLALQKGIEEGRVVAEGYASVRLAIGTEHVRMGKYPIAAKHRDVIERNQANGTNTVEKFLAQREIIDIRRRRPLTPQVDVLRIIHVLAKPGMCFQPACVGQVHRMPDNIIDRGPAVGIDERIRILRNICDTNPLFGALTSGEDFSSDRSTAECAAVARPARSGVRRGALFARPSVPRALI